MSDPNPNQFWTLFDKVTSTVIKEHEATPGTADESLPVGLDANLAWLVESSDPEPAFNPSTHRLEPTETITIDPANPSTGTRVFTFTAVPLSDAQVEDRAIEAKRKRGKARVNAIATKLRNDENITNEETYALLQEIVLRDRLDL